MKKIVVLFFIALGMAPTVRAADFIPMDRLPVKDFTLTERSGKTFQPSDLRGKVWVAHFFFSTCPGPCTKTVPQMKRLQEFFAGKADVRFVSITVRSAHDTPELLKKFADDQNADSEQWLFLTDPDDAKVHRIVQDCFYQSVVKDEKPTDPNNDVTHSPSLLLIDRDGFIMGRVNGEEIRAGETMAREIRREASKKYVRPMVNALLNSLCTMLLIFGYQAIRLRREALHKNLMMAAIVLSAVFLANYLYFHFAVQGSVATKFRGEGLVRWIYFAILLSHTILAIVVAPLVLFVAYEGWKDHRPRHVAVARWTLPIWLYVTITGVIVYVMLYQFYPPY